MDLRRSSNELIRCAGLSELSFFVEHLWTRSVFEQSPYFGASTGPAALLEHLIWNDLCCGVEMEDHNFIRSIRQFASGAHAPDT